MKLLFPIILAAIGVGGGVGAGLVLRPPLIDAEPEAPCAISQTSPDDSTLNKTVILQETDREYVKLTNQFVVPVVRGEMVTSLVLMSLSLEVGEGEDDCGSRGEGGYGGDECIYCSLMYIINTTSILSY